MFLEFATKSILRGLAAAPPNLTAPLRGMGATGPVVIFFIEIRLVTVFTNDIIRLPKPKLLSLLRDF